MKHVGYLTLLALLTAFTPTVASADNAYLNRFNTLSVVASTVPANGDVNPYGIVVVPRTVGNLVRGDVLISNFNSSANEQGTGTTLVEVAPNGAVTLFAQIDAASLPGECPGGVGLTTALSVLRSGWVIVGSLPTSDGTSATAQAGCLIVLNSSGNPIETISGGLINGPWDMTAVEVNGFADLFVTNVLNGTVAASPKTVRRGTVVRLVLGDLGASMPEVVSSTVIGSGFGEKTDPNALVIGPTGVAFGNNGTLYVADTVASRIAAIPNALGLTKSDGTGTTVSSGGALNGPLGLAAAPGGDLVTVNGGDGNMIEVAPSGSQVAVKMVDTTGTGGGSLFGLAITPDNSGVYFVNDGNNTLNLLH